MIVFSLFFAGEYLIFETFIFSSTIAGLVFLFSLFYFYNLPRYRARKASDMIEREIISVARFLALELRSERSIHDALINTSENFAVVGVFIDEILSDVEMGKTLEESIEKAIVICPNKHLRTLLWQLLNSIRTGADISKSLQTFIENVEEKQRIRIENYSNELNALSLFYMMVSIIIPTIGFTIITAILTFIGFEIGLGILISIWVVLTLIQFLFLKYSINRRPNVEGY